ncbi:MAG: sporulation protein YabP [Peptococcaceae bacterium]|jgi:sporulation protein YabP|nr:sporulation protein YabP [Peptococcaceae bacterium]
MSERAANASQRHRLVLDERERMALTGVRKVQSFEPKEIVLETELGMLSVKGEKLGVKHLDLKQGEVHIDGVIESMTYARHSGNSDREGFLTRIFR